MRDAALWVSVLLWLNRGGTKSKLARLLADGCAPPFAAQIMRGDFADVPTLA
jgi:hypothetical protein